MFLLPPTFPVFRDGTNRPDCTNGTDCVLPVLQVFNFLCEVMCTTALVFGAMMMYARRDKLTAENRVLFQSFEGGWVGGWGWKVGWVGGWVRGRSTSIANENRVLFQSFEGV